MTRVGIIAAMPGELAAAGQGMEADLHRQGIYRWEQESSKGTWIAVCAGIGRDRATKAFAEAEKDGALDRGAFHWLGRSAA